MKWNGPSIRDQIEPEDQDVDPVALMDAWINRKLIPKDEHGRTLKHAYAGMEAPHQREAHRIIARGAELIGPNLKVAEEALEAARQQALHRAIVIVEEQFKDFSAFAVVNAIRDEMELNTPDREGKR